jgi:DNA-binding NarL/FixJ family response regulator
MHGSDSHQQSSSNAPEAMRETIEVLLVIQYALLRESLGRLLSTGLGFKVADQCGSIHEALNALRRAPADVVLLDLDFGKQITKEFVRTAKRRGFKGKFLLLANDVNEDDLADFIRSGICGIFQKCEPAALLGHGIRDVVAGNVWFKQKQLQGALNCKDDFLPNIRNSGFGFTQRERSVLSLVSEGLTNKEIGEQIGISEGSVKAALQQLFSKFGVRSRSHLVRIALEQHKSRTSN